MLYLTRHHLFHHFHFHFHSFLRLLSLLHHLLSLPLVPFVGPNLCARVITFACTSSSRLIITCGMAFNSAMISGCSKNFSLLPIPATHAHTNDTYGVIVNFT